MEENIFTQLLKLVIIAESMQPINFVGGLSYLQRESQPVDLSQF